MTIHLRTAPGYVPVMQEEPPEWMLSALCAQTDPDLWHPETGGDARPAKRICNGNADKGIAPCPVKAECLAHALEHNERAGVWGGLSERERSKLRRSRATGPAPCGTVGGYHSHQYRGQTPCQPCRDARQEYQRELRRRKRTA